MLQDIFGGILLGTGGLVRCYSDALLGSINMAEKVLFNKGIEFNVEIDYNNLENFKYYCKKNNINIIDLLYSEKIICKIVLGKDFEMKFLENIEKKEINIINVNKIGSKYIRKNVIKK